MDSSLDEGKKGTSAEGEGKSGRKGPRHGEDSR